MRSSSIPPGPSQVPSWVLRANDVIERLYLVLRVNLVWGLFSVLGLVVFGIAPASVAAADAFIAARYGAKVRVLPVMWASFRAHLITANVRLVPLMAVQGGAVAILWLLSIGALPGPAPAAALGVLAAISGAWASVSVAAIVVTPRLRRQDPLVAWRLALLVPGAIPFRAILTVLGLVMWMVLCTLIWPVALLAGAATAIDLATGLLSSRIERLLEEIDTRMDDGD